MGKFIIRTVPTGYKFDLRAANGETVATSEVYQTEAACRKGVASVQRCALVAQLEDRTCQPVTQCKNPKFELYQDKSGAFRFRLRSRNGAIIAVSECYSTKNGCLEGIESVRNNVNFQENL